MISSARGQSVKARTESWQWRTTGPSQIPERHTAKTKRGAGADGQTREKAKVKGRFAGSDLYDRERDRRAMM